MWTFVIIFIIFIYYLVYKKVSIIYSYWSSKGIKGPKPNFVIGNMGQAVWPRKYSIITVAAKLYNDYSKEKVVGIYQGLTPTLIVRDPEIMKTIIVKDFSSFNSRGIVVSEKFLNLFNAEKDEWKTMRKNFAPLFSSAKLKPMFSLLEVCIGKHMDFLDKTVADDPCVEMYNLNMKYTIKSVCSAVLGVELETHSEEINEILNVASDLQKNDYIRRIGYILSNICPGKILGFLYSQILSSFSIYFKNLVAQILQKGKKYPNNNIKNNCENLITMKQKKVEITEEELTNQIIMFFAAGFETTAGAMTFLMYELALNPTIQARCQKEIDASMKKYNCKLDYDVLTTELHYLNMVLDETLRKYPVGGLLIRQSLTDYTFNEIKLSIKKGTKIWVPVLGLHTDPKYFPEPEKFNPDRFLPENRKSFRDFYFPFGDGPRICVGMRFARMQFLLGVVHFLHKFQVSQCSKTTKSVKFDPRILVLAPDGGIWLNIDKRNRNNLEA